MKEDCQELLAPGIRQRLPEGGSQRQGHLIKAFAVALAAMIVALAIEFRSGFAARPDMELKLAELETVSQSARAYRHLPGATMIRFAVAPVLSPTATARSFSALAQYLSAGLDQPVQLILGKSYAEINALVRQREVAIALVCSGAYILGRREFGMKALAAPVVDGRKSYRSYIIVRSDSRLSSWRDLRGRTFAFTDPMSNSGRLAPAYLLARNGFTPGSFFRNVTFTYSHDLSIEAVANGLVDGAAVDSLVYHRMIVAEPSLGSRTRIVWRSEPYGINPIVVAPGLDAGLTRRIERTLLDMNRHAQGRKVLAQLGVDRFEKPDARSYDLIEAMGRSLGAL